MALDRERLGATLTRPAIPRFKMKLFRPDDVEAAFDEAGLPLQPVYDERGQPTGTSFVSWYPMLDVDVVESPEVAAGRQAVPLSSPMRRLEKRCESNVVVFLYDDDARTRCRVDDALRLLARDAPG
jgi:hypothetical protein